MQPVAASVFPANASGTYKGAPAGSLWRGAKDSCELDDPPPRRCSTIWDQKAAKKRSSRLNTLWLYVRSGSLLACS